MKNPLQHASRWKVTGWEIEDDGITASITVEIDLLDSVWDDHGEELDQFDNDFVDEQGNKWYCWSSGDTSTLSNEHTRATYHIGLSVNAPQPDWRFPVAFLLPG